MKAVCEKIPVKQLLNTMPSDLKVWVGERKPKTGEEAGRLADDYLQARQRDGAVIKQFSIRSQEVSHLRIREAHCQELSEVDTFTACRDTRVGAYRSGVHAEETPEVLQLWGGRPHLHAVPGQSTLLRRK